MALSLSQTDAVRRLIQPGMRICSFGYPDLIAPILDLPGLKYRADSDAICKRHGLTPRQIPDAESYFAISGCKLDVYDIVNERGCEILCDLNQSAHPIYIGPSYDIVLDVGTAEHCFNIGQAMMNMAEMVKEGGYIIHENPASSGNHGFYNLNPTLFYDFYTGNGFAVEDLKLVTRDGRSVGVHPVHRFRFPNEELNIFCLARRVKVQDFIFPTQTKYKKLIPAAEVSGDAPPAKRAIGGVNA